MFEEMLRPFMEFPDTLLNRDVIMKDTYFVLPRMNSQESGDLLENYVMHIINRSSLKADIRKFLRTDEFRGVKKLYDFNIDSPDVVRKLESISEQSEVKGCVDAKIRVLKGTLSREQADQIGCRR